MAKAIIKQIKSGKQSQQFKFILLADNGEPLDPRDFYHNLDDLKEMLQKYFPNFEVIDLSNVDI
jgi:hypothetical protein